MKINLEEQRQRDLEKTDLSDVRAVANVNRYYSDEKYRKQQQRIQRRLMRELETALGL